MDTTGLAYLLAQDDGGAAAAGGMMALFTGGMFCLIELALFALWFAGGWKTFQKAGEPGWAAIVPIYNWMVAAKIAGKEMWWGLMLLIPCVGIVFAFMIFIEFAKKFGKDAVFGVLMVLFPYVMFPILGFGSAKYQGGATT